MIKFKHVNRVGCELEGCFAPNQIDPDAFSAFPNGGIKNECTELNAEEQRIRVEQNLIMGERNSPPCDNLRRLRKWITTFYPKLYNRSCGFHIHVSFKNDKLRHEVIASKKFHDDFLKAAKEFVQKEKYNFGRDMLDRVVRGMCGYARHDYNPAARGAVHALSHHNTCEFRIFSGAMNPTQAKKCVTWLVTFVEEYLDEHFMREACKNKGVVYRQYNGRAMN